MKNKRTTILKTSTTTTTTGCGKRVDWLTPFYVNDLSARQKSESSGKKLKSVFNFLTYLRETWFLFSYAKVVGLIRLIEASDEINGVSIFDNSLSFGAKQNAVRQIFFALWFFKDLFTKNLNGIFFNFFLFCVGSIKECIHVYLGMQI